MGYQALLFCPDDKTARTLTQVLSELEFTVEACIEPFAAVKKLMGQHFDAVVVDCDNEQNATLLFKSARNSTSNQTSLAVAVVEGQAGVAKAFRIGANLVLTKPINIEQAKGTLRVARGLLRKSEPGKPGSATATGSFAIPTTPAPTPTPASETQSSPAVPPAAAAPRPAAKPAVPVARPTSLPPKPVPPAAKPTPTPAWPAAPVAAKPAATIPATPAPVAEKPVPPPAPPAPPVLYSAAVATPPSPRASTATPASEFRPSHPSAAVTGGAASAPAPALEPPQTKVEPKSRVAAEELFEKPAEAVPSEPAPYAGSAPSFSFGGATEERESSGAGKKAIIGIAAAIVIAAGYFGWSHVKGTSSSTQTAATLAPVSASESSKPSNAQPAMTATTSAPVSQPDISLGTASGSSENEHTSSLTSEHSRPSAGSTKSANAAAPPAKSSVAEKADKPVEEEEQPEAPALVVKGGKVPGTRSATPSADAPAPSLIGLGASTAAPLPNLGTSESEVKPKLQTLSVSQGVSQGLLYKKVAPSYPQNALRMHIDGTVELLATISKEGNITHIKVLNGDAQLAKAASDAVKQWKYKPYLLNGEPVEIQTQVTVNFKLPH